MTAENAIKVTALHASPLGRYIVAGFDDGSIRAWSVVDGALVLTLVGAHRRAVQCIVRAARAGVN
jgi:WD40 repeat protein